MRCKACDKQLTEFESTRKYAGSQEFVDLCNECFKYVKGIQVDERPDLQKEWEITGD